MPLVGGQQQPGPVGGQGRIRGEERGQHVALVDLRAGQGPGDGNPGGGAEQEQAPSPGEA
ncbi:hypothetical protein DEF23_10940 [Marinitenerispora sediminis]|nr:hypothetical protein DEF23_10940 [Marinitenerispora sediminis]